MKHLTRLPFLCLCALGLSSCAIYDLLPTRASTNQGSSSGVPTSAGNPEDLLKSTESAIEAKAIKEGQSAMGYHYSDFLNHNVAELAGAPSLGKARLLVLPIWFSDSTDFIKKDHRENVRNDLYLSYFGTASETGWHSVKSYYEEESMGRLHLDGTVAPWYETGKRYTAFADADQGGIATETLVEEATDWFFRAYPSEKRSDYDLDHNGYLDGVMLLYAAPDYQTSRKNSQSNLWAYCYWLQDSSQKSLNSPGANVFFWASYDFIYGGGLTTSGRTGKSSLGGGDTRYCSVDAHTYIHEMGHVFGLDDYYDYGPGTYTPAGGFSMQDYNVGGHDPYSAMALGWADPYIPTASTSITLKPFQKEHDCILLTPEWNNLRSPFDEYLLLEFYTPTGLNAFDATHDYNNTGVKGPSASGIRLWHVDSRLLACNKVQRGEDGYDYAAWDESDLTSDPRAGRYGVGHAFSNSYDDESYSGALALVDSKYDDYDLLQLIRNSTLADTHPSEKLKSSDLFGDGSAFTWSRYQSQFPNGGLMNKNRALGWSFSVSIEGSGEEAVATVSLTKA